VGFRGLKIDTVVMRGVNEDELVGLLEYGKRVGAEVRFIEYMDVGGATQWSREKVFSRVEILEVLGRRYGRIDPIIEVSSAPAERFALPTRAVEPDGEPGLFVEALDLGAMSVRL
jgi:cyclic pyranopterin phosphate synthase